MTFGQWLQSDGLKLFKGYNYKGQFETGLKEAIEAVWNAAYAQGYEDCAIGIKPTNVELTIETVTFAINPKV